MTTSEFGTDRSAAPAPRTALLRRPSALWISEFAATALLLLAMAVLFGQLSHPEGWLRLRIPSAAGRLLVDAVVSGGVVALLIASPLGRVSGAHMNPAVTVVLWVARLLPGRHVPLYVTAQLVGSVAGTVLGRLAVGAPLSHPDVDYALLSPAIPAPATFIAIGEGIATAILLVSVVRLAHRSDLARSAPVLVGAILFALIMYVGGSTGGSLNPARQFGPWLLSGADTGLWPYVTGPLAAAVVVGVGSVLLRSLARRRRHAR
ncbi:MIP/aquaporin family protein [Streptomyces sp. NPDC056222]|uniref:MIP/aquaporin family protein n=1 Tax=Streptomyces sp. NPDC056222 TaxID=3345749 RepID=UPI0035D9DED3